MANGILASVTGGMPKLSQMGMPAGGASGGSGAKGVLPSAAASSSPNSGIPGMKPLNLPDWASDPSKADLGAMAGPMAGATSWSPDANATASGQLEKLLAKDNPLLQQARTRAAQKMNGMGLMNSSMAIGAGESAMYDVAIPIATNDAQTFAKAQSENAAAANQFAMQGNQFAQNSALARFNGVLSLAAQDRDLQGKWAMQTGSQSWQAGENALERQNRLDMQTGQQGFQAWQAGLDRAQQLNMQSNQFGQNALDRQQQLAMQQNQFGFQGGQAALDRAQQLNMQSNQFGQNALDRAQQLQMQGNQFAFQGGQSALERAQQLQMQGNQFGFQAGQAGLDRAQQLQMQSNQLGFQGQQSALDRQMQTDLQAGRISAEAVQAQLNREQQLRVQQLQEQGMDSRQASQIAAQERQQREQNVFAGQQNTLDRQNRLDLQTGQQQWQGQQSQMDRQMQADLQAGRITAESVQNQLNREQQSRMVQLQEGGMDARQASQIAAQERQQREQQLFQGKQADMDRAQQLKMQLGDQQFRQVQSQLDREQQSRMQELQEKGMDSRQAQQIASQERIQREQNLLQRDELQYRKDATAAEMAFKNRDLDVRSNQWGKEQQAKQAELISQIRRQAAEARNRIETDDKLDWQAKQTAIIALVNAADHDIAELIQASGIATPGYWPSWMRDTRYWDEQKSGSGGSGTKTNTDTRDNQDRIDRINDYKGNPGDKTGSWNDTSLDNNRTNYYDIRPMRDRAAADAALARKRGEEDRIWDDMRRRVEIGGVGSVGSGSRPPMMSMGGASRPGVLAQAASARGSSGPAFGRSTGAPVRDPSLPGPGNGGIVPPHMGTPRTPGPSLGEGKRPRMEGAPVRDALPPGNGGGRVPPPDLGLLRGDPAFKFAPPPTSGGPARDPELEALLAMRRGGGS